MSDDLPISDVADQLHDDLLVKRLTDSDNTGFSNDLEKGASVDEVAKTASRRVFLQPRYALYRQSSVALNYYLTQTKDLRRELSQSLRVVQVTPEIEQLARFSADASVHR